MRALAAPIEDERLVADALRGLDELFLLVVVGEFNAGKSALLNELLGARLLEEGVTPTTAAITLVRHGETEAQEWRGEAFLERRLPSPALRDLAVVDTPGTNAIVRRHEELTREFVPRADLVLFATSADRPFTETERALLAAIREWGKKVVVVINKVDLLADEKALAQVVEFVREGLRAELGAEPPVYPTSVRLARAAAENPDAAVARAIARSAGVDELRRYVFETLDPAQRLKLKLATPVGVAKHLLTRYSRIVDERAAAMAEETQLAENVERQVALHAEELRAAFGPRLAQIENVIHELNDRGQSFFEDTFRIGRVFDLFNAERTRGAFEREVVADSAARIDRLVDDLVDWFVQSESRLWAQVSGMVGRRQAAVVANPDPDFIATRREVLRTVSERTREALAGFDRDREARAFSSTMRDAIAQTAIAEVGALSLGAAIAIAVGTVAADVTGLLAATVAAGLGLYILPARRRRALAEFRRKTDELRERLATALATQLDREIAGSSERVREAVAPYTRYVRAEADRLREQQRGLAELKERIGKLAAEVEAL